ncbi:DUF6888 family protein [Gloeobacter violaceus]|uniref:Gsl3187 protein n=1 Tax=Gloeobacter violaceus (strain ATCC 29082 / PCC 7421) TaxID=251221 RepID=Q7NGI2_GLOVI|nr:hypothetical protein [Gloeobacter violaceus]BAC91128.1 gsl3187 [Gloeobacter violaceus PCC 7421]
MHEPPQTSVPTPAQLRKCYEVCCNLTRFYRSINLLTLDPRYNEVYILTSGNLEVLISPTGDARYLPL